MKGSIDWDEEVFHAARSGKLYEFLKQLPKERWTERDPYDEETFLHFAARGKNAKALVALLKGGLDPNDPIDATYPTAAHVAIAYGNLPALEVLCACGARVNALLDKAICNESPLKPNGSIKVLLANGARLRNAAWAARLGQVTPDMIAFERGVLQCRAVAVALLGIKRKRADWSHVDKFLMRELAFAVWAERANEIWMH